MFRASQIASEETLPVLGTVTIISTTDDANESNVGTNIKRGDGQSTYGTNTIISSSKIKYPAAVAFILITKFFEAFAANGMRTILALYLRDDLFFSESFSTIMLHIFNFFGQFCPIFGAILADSYIGNVRTISSFCVLYAFGWILLILTSLPNMGISLIFLISASLLFIAVGNGSIRACITSLGALQFKVPEQACQLAEYFFLYYFVYYFGIFLSKILPPLVRANTQCFNKNGCYPAVFGTLATSFMLSWTIFMIGKFFYKPEKLSEENILIKFYGCIKYAIIKKCTRSKKEPRPSYWLNNAIGRYDKNFVDDVAKVLKISKLFIPLPIYFALLAQQDSSWTFQATLMNTTIAGITLQPDQAKAMGPIFLFILIPLWQYLFAPLFKHLFGFELKPLHSVTVGGICSAISFLCAGILQENIFGQPYKSINIVWQVPQFLMIMMGELFLSIPGLQFAFTQAPTSMKSVVTAAWFLNNAFGNLIVIIITKIDIFDSQSNEYFFYAVIMLVSIIIFTLLAYDYILQEQLLSYHVNNTLVTRKENTIANGLTKDNDMKDDMADLPSTSSSVCNTLQDKNYIA
ncbi:solute carrier family 15 member 1 [Teleopsis dalmanni]|uniref:solute carrier family 15 member 1 n=1 Tax=Teleopsis dalmanni TaxID=139649 RepID=UPI0018CE7948|nr:solute carrier family 15 member 1 [Teleopsis dalmanni]XP_037949777.1 solute carrier family 15 member 1 [Teleopsis dalmanni]